MLHVSPFSEALSEGVVRCTLCRHRCTISPDRRGVCGVRENRNGILYSLAYGQLVAEHVDPVEKKPLFHLLPGTLSYSIASVGCNFHCHHCQNFAIAQFATPPDGRVPGRFRTPEQVVAQAVQEGCASIAYTYTEPTVSLEYVRDVAQVAAASGLKNIMVTNGYITPEALDDIAPFLDGANIDLKGFSELFYQTVAGARLDEVCACIRDYRQRGIWIEITTLLIPGENDTREQMEGVASFVATDLGVDTPWHVSRFYPCHRMTDHPPTPVERLSLALDIGHRCGLRYLYVGNCPGAEDTCCPTCGAVLIKRHGYQVTDMNIVNGQCQKCAMSIAGVW